MIKICKKFVGQEIQCGKKSLLLEYSVRIYVLLVATRLLIQVGPYIMYKRQRMKERDEMRFLTCAALPRDDGDNDDDDDHDHDGATRGVLHLQSRVTYKRTLVFIGTLANQGRSAILTHVDTSGTSHFSRDAFFL